MEESRIHPNYQGMLQIRQQKRVENAVSETQSLLLGMDAGARWSHDLSHRVNSRGGNEGDVTQQALNANGEPDPLEFDELS